MAHVIHEVFDSSRVISNYFVTGSEGYLIYTELTKKEPVQSFLHLRKIKTDRDSSEIQYRLNVPAYHLESFQAKIQVVNVTHVTRSRLENSFVLLVNEGDGLQLIKFENLFKDGCTKRATLEPNKWRHTEVGDMITSFFAYNTRGQHLQVVYCTRLGSVKKLSYDITTSTFQEIDGIRNATGDILNSCAPCYALDFCKSESVEVPELLFSCFDNNVYVYDKKLERIAVADVFDDNKTLVFAEGVIAKKYSTNALIFYACNITNSGCHLFKKNIMGQWDLVEIFTRDLSVEEKSPLVDCHIYCSGRTKLTIVSGSENGKLYSWEYDYLDEVIVDTHVLEVGASYDVVHCLQSREDKIYYMLNKDTIGYTHRS